jgi:hypothetical protein
MERQDESRLNGLLGGIAERRGCERGSSGSWKWDEVARYDRFLQEKAIDPRSTRLLTGPWEDTVLGQP